MKPFLWNMLISLKNGYKSNKSYIIFPKNNICFLILNNLWDEGFIAGYKIFNTSPNLCKIYLKYKKGQPSIKTLKFLSKPGNKFYYSIKQLWKIHSNFGIILISTNNGVLTVNNCKKYNLGGKPLIIIK